MARDDVFITRFGPTVPGNAEGVSNQARINRQAAVVVTDFWTQLNLDGRLFHVQFGTRDADGAITSTTVPDDQLVEAVVDNNTGYIMIPARAQLAVKGWTTATLMGAYLEADKSKKRYSSGGTAFVPENLNGLDGAAFSGNAYVGTDVTTLAKSAVPDSVEFAHLLSQEDAQATPDVAATQSVIQTVWDAKNAAAFPILPGPSSFLFHFGATTADLTGYGFMQFAQLTRAEITAS